NLHGRSGGAKRETRPESDSEAGRRRGHAIRCSAARYYPGWSPNPRSKPNCTIETDRRSQGGQGQGVSLPRNQGTAGPAISSHVRLRAVETALLGRSHVLTGLRMARSAHWKSIYSCSKVQSTLV